MIPNFGQTMKGNDMDSRLITIARALAIVGHATIVAASGTSLYERWKKNKENKDDLFVLIEDGQPIDRCVRSLDAAEKWVAGAFTGTTRAYKRVVLS